MEARRAEGQSLKQRLGTLCTNLQHTLIQMSAFQAEIQAAECSWNGERKRRRNHFTIDKVATRVIQRSTQSTVIAEWLVTDNANLHVIIHGSRSLR